MRPALFAFAIAATFFGAALYISLVEQPARLALHVRSMLQEWMVSNRRGFAMLATLAIISAVLAYIDYGRTGDVRLLIGATVIMASWPYAYFVMMPVNIWLYYNLPAKATSIIRALMRDWGLLEWGQCAIGFGACCVYAWVLLAPA
jgi:hypothetical protein